MQHGILTCIRRQGPAASISRCHLSFADSVCGALLSMALDCRLIVALALLKTDRLNILTGDFQTPQL